MPERAVRHPALVVHLPVGLKTRSMGVDRRRWGMYAPVLHAIRLRLGVRVKIMGSIIISEICPYASSLSRVLIMYFIITTHEQVPESDPQNGVGRGGR
eukprot:COSAG01_NODE_8283_length_2845_cov_1.939184_3_plen_98_part_00